jgi:hypothetical protein
MTHPADVFGWACAIALVSMVATPLPVSAQSPLVELSLEDLMKLDAGQVFGASERLQPVLQAPASVSFVTAEETARYGYRTLADILRGVRGMYVTNDRNYTYIGTRGFSNPGGAIGHAFASGVDVAVSGTAEYTGGVRQLYFPAFDAPSTNDGVADGLDGEGVEQLYGRLDFRGLTATGTYGTRRRGVPTASFLTLFNAQTPPEETTDRHTLLDAAYGAGGVRNIFDNRYADPVSLGHAQDSIAQNGRTARIGLRWRLGPKAPAPP